MFYFINWTIISGNGTELIDALSEQTDELSKVSMLTGAKNDGANLIKISQSSHAKSNVNPEYLQIK